MSGVLPTTGSVTDLVRFDLNYGTGTGALGSISPAGFFQSYDPTPNVSLRVTTTAPADVEVLWR